MKPTLEANLVYVMNINIVPITILDVSKVFSWSHNHFIHWSYMIASISIYINQHFMWQCIEWDEISYAHVYECLDDACAHEIQISNAMLNIGVLQFGSSVFQEIWFLENGNRLVPKILVTKHFGFWLFWFVLILTELTWILSMKVRTIKNRDILKQI